MKGDTACFNLSWLLPTSVTPLTLNPFLPALGRSHNPKIVFMGSLSGRDNFSGREVANSASKFDLRGVVHSLREELLEARAESWAIAANWCDDY
jgi:NAD(P)-dependent dehydrogenase (short-subunit alcohol dehydrogenase family)